MPMSRQMVQLNGLPMSCMWFPDPIGEYAGFIRGQAITSSTPAFLVCAGGWPPADRLALAQSWEAW